MLGLPETGVSDAATWLALLGPNAQPADLMGLSSGDVQYNDDMADHSHDGSIYLVVRSSILAYLSAPSVGVTFSSQEYNDDMAGHSHDGSICNAVRSCRAT